MRRVKHWTPRYLVNRLRLMAYERRHPDVPWLTQEMVALLGSWLRSEDHALEWGAGRSTLWLARRVGRLTSVEHNLSYHRRLKARLEAEGQHNVELRFCEREDEYVAVATQLPPESLDLVLVDGVARDLCALAALPRLKPGGILVLDNSNRYLPSGSCAPASRRPPQGPASETWGLFASRVQQWRCLWTSNGVFDTALWVKPAGPLPPAAGASGT
ncbi:MAG: O-methyltransferase [Terriglobia bacterium]